MAKKVKIQKLLKSPGTPQSQSPSAHQSYKSAFSSHSQKLQRAKQKKIEKLKQTRDRLMNKSKHNVSVKIQGSRLGIKSNKVNKFALLDDRDGQAENRYEPQNRLTHRGTEVGKIKHFNDMHFDNDEQHENYDDAEFDQMHGEANFHGFDNEDNNDNNNDEGGVQNKRKSKNEIYKEIIQKSRSHKRDRQEQYEENFNKAVELDEKFPQFVANLKFRNNDAKVRDKLTNRDLQYERLLNELKDEERVVASRVADNSKKGIEKIKKKKNVQLGQLMKQASDDEDEEDIRGWVKGLDEDEDQNDGDSGSEQSGEEGEGEDEQGQAGSDDEIDDVQLSSGDEEEEQAQKEGEQDEGQDQEDEQDEQQSNNKNILIKSASEDSDEEESQNQNESQSQQQQQEQAEEVGKYAKKNKKIVKNTQNKSFPQPKPAQKNHQNTNNKQSSKKGKYNNRKHH